MTFVLGRDGGTDAGPCCRLGSYRALDGSDGAPLCVDIDGPHAALVVGKRGYGKSYTLGVFAEALARTTGVAPIVFDPMGVFTPMAGGTRTGVDPVPTAVVSSPTIAPTTLDPQSWCDLLGLSPESGAGGVLWQAAGTAPTLAAMGAAVRAVDAPTRHQRAVLNHLSLADSWGVFDPNGLSAAEIATSELTVLDLSELDSAPANALARGIGDALYRARVDGVIERLPWILVDEVHAFFDGVAAPTLARLLTRGRAPGVSLVLATQRPSAIPAVGRSQSDLLLSHRLTSQADLDALARVRPSYMGRSLENQMPSEPGEVVAVDDATESVHTAHVRQRQTPHGGASPRASDYR